MESNRESARRGVVDVVTATRQLEGEGFEVRRPFPTRKIPHFDPFLVLDEMGPMVHEPGAAKGAPDHPHRGFETVTYLLDGEFEHEDSAGHRGILRAGDVQWMTAGNGVVHSEVPSKEFQATGGRLHGFQLWVNLPRSDKRMAPRYQEIPASRIPVVERDGVRVRVIAGESLGAKAVIETRTPILYLHFTIAPGARVEQAIPEGFHVFGYVFAGAVESGDDRRVVSDGQIALFGESGDAITLSVPHDASKPAEVLIIGGQPLREPVVQYGPFVMNTRQEIVEAIDDYQSGRMGRIDR